MIQAKYSKDTDCPGDPVVKNLPPNAEDAGLFPGKQLRTDATKKK